MISIQIQLACDNPTCTRYLDSRATQPGLSVAQVLTDAFQRHGWQASVDRALCYEHRTRPIPFHPFKGKGAEGFWAGFCTKCNRMEDHINHHPERVVGLAIQRGQHPKGES